MSKFIGVHTVTYSSTPDLDGNYRHISKEITYVNVDLVETISAYGKDVTVLYFNSGTKEIVEGTPADIFCSIV